MVLLGDVALKFKEFKNKIDIKTTGYRRYIAFAVNIILIFVLFVGGEALFKKLNLSPELFLPSFIGACFVVVLVFLIIYNLFIKKQDLSKEETYSLGLSKFPNIVPISGNSDVYKITNDILDGIETESYREYEINSSYTKSSVLFSQSFWRIREICDSDNVGDEKYEMVNCEIFRFDVIKNSSTPVISSFNKKIIRNHTESIETENMEFNEKFYIKATDEENAFYVLTPSVMEHLLYLNERFPKTIFYFKDNYLYVIFYDSGAFKKYGLVYNDKYLEQLAIVDGNFKHLIKELDTLIK